jgi:PBSX family phage terminase large subunit
MDFFINPAYQHLLTSKKKYLVLKGGAGSGKTTFAIQKVFLRLMSEEKHRFLVIKKIKDSIRTGIFREFTDIITQYELDEYFKINQTDFTITYLPNKNEIIFKGLDSESKIRGIKGISSILVDEASDLEEEDMLQLIARLREPNDNYKQFIICLNPTDEEHFLKKMFFDIEDDPDVLTLSTTFHDNLALPEDFKIDIEKRYRGNERMYRIYILGEWGSTSTKGQMFNQFEYTKHVKPTAYNPDKTLHISIDFNTLPYCSLSVWQINKAVKDEVTTNELHCIDEITGDGTKETCINFLSKYSNHQSPVYYYGDPSGKKEDTRSERGYNDFKILQLVLDEFSLTSKLLSKQPPVHKRAEWINLIFESEYENFRIIIDPSCKKVIYDLLYAKVDESGDKFVQKKKDKETGRSYETTHHWVDGMAYFICSAFQTDFNNYLHGRKSSTPIPQYRFGSYTIPNNKRMW